MSALLDMYKKLRVGEFGRTFRFWFSVQEFMDSMYTGFLTIMELDSKKLLNTNPSCLRKDVKKLSTYVITEFIHPETLLDPTKDAELMLVKERLDKQYPMYTFTYVLLSCGYKIRFIL